MRSGSSLKQQVHVGRRRVALWIPELYVFLPLGDEIERVSVKSYDGQKLGLEE